MKSFVFFTTIILFISSTISIADNCGDWGYNPMDFNQNCRVDLADLALFAESWASCTDPANPNCIMLAPPSLQVIIDSASPGDEIVVSAGRYIATLEINKNIHLRSADGPDVTTIDANHNGAVLNFSGTESAACIIEGFTLKNGSLGCISGNGATATLKNCIIRENYGSNTIAYFDGNILNSVIISNTSTDSTALLAFCDGTIANNQFFSNTTGADNSFFAVCNGTIENNIVSHNTAGAATFVLCDGNIRNNTIYDNATPQGTWFGCAATITNNIDWGNTVGGITILSGHTSSTPTYCDIENDTTAGIGNINLDPLFVNADANDFRLSSTSPCVNAGSSLNAPSSDFNGYARDLNPDMGAHEYGGVPMPVENITTGSFYATIQDAIDNASSGETIEVSDGIYHVPANGNAVVEFKGVNITLKSKNGPETTILDAQGNPSEITVVLFNGRETSACILEGFTIKGGYKSSAAGGLTCGISGNGNGDSFVTQATVKNCIITDNHEGHLIWPFYGNILNCHIYGNTSTPSAGKALLVDCDGLIAGNLIENNVTSSYNGLIVISDGVIENNVIINNSIGAGIIHYNNGLFRNNTIYGNTSTNQTFTGTGGTYVNNIDWNNSTPGTASTLNISYTVSNVSISGVGNITSNPNFVNAGAKNFHLNSISPCIDAGNPSNYPSYDFDGAARDTNPDIGAYEYQP